MAMDIMFYSMVSIFVASIGAVWIFNNPDKASSDKASSDEDE